MQIQSGWAKGLSLDSPKGLGTRPTSSKVRAAVFDMLRFRCELVKMIDLFSGSGAMALESISQGATQVTLVDKSQVAIEAAKKNLGRLKKAGSKIDHRFDAHVSKKDVTQFLAQHPADGQYDFIWVDPPYSIALEMLPLFLKFANEHLSNSGCLVIEAAAKDSAALENADLSGFNLKLAKIKRYGDTIIQLYEKQ